MDKITYNKRNYYLYKGSKYFETSSKGKYRRLHQQVWFDNFGEIPKDFDVHHKDENVYNNNISNLELLTKKDHCKHHMTKRVKENPEYFKRLAETGRKFAKEWHKSEEGFRWHSENGKKYGLGTFEPVERNCLNCNSSFVANSYRAAFCSNKCKSGYRRKQNKDTEGRTCVTCGTLYECNKYSQSKNCSSKCAARSRNKN